MIRITFKYASHLGEYFCFTFFNHLERIQVFCTLPSSHDGTVDDSETSGEYNQIGLVVYLVTI